MVRNKNRYYINNLNEITLIITKNCNLNCKYCLQEHSSENQNLDNIINFFNEIKISELNKPITIEFFGGEPFLNPELIFQTVYFLRKILSGPQRQYIKFKFITNGTIFNKEVINIFNAIKKFSFNIPKLIISYDGLWQDLRNKNTIELVENNILEILKTNCLKKILNITFSYNGLLEQDLVKNYLYLINKFPISIYNLNHYYIREPWNWDNEKYKKYKEDFFNLIKLDYFFYKTDKKHINYIQKLINKIKNPSYKNRLGCEYGNTRVTLIQNKISGCGLDNNFNIEFLDNNLKQKILDYCSNCEINQYCEKTCPKKILFKDNLLCEIKKFEIKLIQKYIQKYY